MTDEQPSVQVQFTDDFKRQLATLAKKYRQIRSDVQPILAQLQEGNFVGNQIAGTGYTVFKVRVKNSDIQKGKSSGYRLIYQLQSPNSILLLLIYSKSDQTDVAAEEIQSAISEFYQSLDDS